MIRSDSPLTQVGSFRAPTLTRPEASVLEEVELTTGETRDTGVSSKRVGLGMLALGGLSLLAACGPDAAPESRLAPRFDSEMSREPTGSS